MLEHHVPNIAVLCVDNSLPVRFVFLVSRWHFYYDLTFCEIAQHLIDDVTVFFLLFFLRKCHVLWNLHRFLTLMFAKFITFWRYPYVSHSFIFTKCIVWTTWLEKKMSMLHLYIPTLRRKKKRTEQCNSDVMCNEVELNRVPVFERGVRDFVMIEFIFERWFSSSINGWYKWCSFVIWVI